MDSAEPLGNFILRSVYPILVPTYFYASLIAAYHPIYIAAFKINTKEGGKRSSKIKWHVKLWFLLSFSLPWSSWPPPLMFLLQQLWKIQLMVQLQLETTISLVFFNSTNTSFSHSIISCLLIYRCGYIFYSLSKIHIFRWLKIWTFLRFLFLKQKRKGKNIFDTSETDYKTSHQHQFKGKASTTLL